MKDTTKPRKPIKPLTLGEKLMILRRRSNLVQHYIAKELGVAKDTVLSWEAGKTSPNVAQIEKMADIYGVTLEDLIFDKQKAFTLHHKEDLDAQMIDRIAALVNLSAKDKLPIIEVIDAYVQQKCMVKLDIPPILINSETKVVAKDPPEHNHLVEIGDEFQHLGNRKVYTVIDNDVKLKINNEWFPAVAYKEKASGEDVYVRSLNNFLDRFTDVILKE